MPVENTMKAMITKLGLLLAIAGLMVATSSCDRTTGSEDANQSPTVNFVNTPQDSTEFSFAPIVYWIGYDADGLISGYEFHDDTSTAAREAYQNNTLAAYVATLGPEDWVYTTRTQETIYLGTQVGDTTDHIFFVRAIDNRGARSKNEDVRARVFFRTNQAPFAPRLKWALADTEYVREMHIPDTLFLGDTTTIVYPGIEILWQGSDPDDKDLVVIPLEFRWVLVRVRDFDGNALSDTIRHPILDDSNHVVGYEGGWSDWTDLNSVIFYAGYNPDTLETGDYEFTLQVRDDGLTPAELPATLTFTAIRPTFEKQLLVIDENKTPSQVERDRNGARSDLGIMAFYHDVLPDAFNTAEELRILQGLQELIPYSLAWDPSTVDFVRIGDTNPAGARVAYREIHRYKWVWVINDDNPDPGFATVEDRQDVLARYMDVGGQVMISGRRVFNGGHAMNGCGTVASGDANGAFFARYFNLFTFCAKGRYTASEGTPDFKGATTPDPFLPDLKLDSALCRDSLQWGTNRRFSRLPEIDYFSRVQTQSGFDFSQSLYNYESASVETVVVRDNVGCDVISSTETTVSVAPPENYRQYLNAVRVFNFTRGCNAEYTGNGFESGRTVLLCSLPGGCGSWSASDSLQVDYSFFAYERKFVDCDIYTSTPSRAHLELLDGDSTALSASRIYNRTRNCYGEFLQTQQDFSRWLIIVSTPESQGRWQDDDTLEVDYTYIPVSHNHNRPVAVVFQKQEGSFVGDEFGGFRITLQARFRSALFTFPFSFMDTTPVDIPFLGPKNPIAVVIANEILFFNQPSVQSIIEFD